MSGSVAAIALALIGSVPTTKQLTIGTSVDWPPHVKIIALLPKDLNPSRVVPGIAIDRKPNPIPRGFMRIDLFLVNA